VTTCVIMQPTYLPWAGYFNLMHSADHFIFYDDADFSKGSWHNRNRILINSSASWITIPVHHKLNTKIMDVFPVYSSGWVQKHSNMIKSVYGKSKYFRDIYPILDFIDNLSCENLADINISIIEILSGLLDIKCDVYRSSSFDVSGDRSNKIISLCESVGCDEYLSPVGAMDYITQDGVIPGSHIDVRYQMFDAVSYPQKSDAFIPCMSIVDVIVNIGLDASKKYIRGEYGL
jgi:hypothetical protein